MYGGPRNEAFFQKEACTCSLSAIVMVWILKLPGGSKYKIRNTQHDDTIINRTTLTDRLILVWFYARLLHCTCTSMYELQNVCIPISLSLFIPYIYKLRSLFYWNDFIYHNFTARTYMYHNAYCSSCGTMDCHCLLTITCLRGNNHGICQKSNGCSKHQITEKTNYKL